MLLITSAFPGLKRIDENGRDIGPDVVARCVASWQANGFRVLSVHNAAERPLIGDGLPGVEYRFIEEPLPEGARRLPTLKAVLGSVPQDEPVGIVNADIFMVPFPEMAARMAESARQAALVVHRWDVRSLTRREGRRFDLGVDLFAFTPSRIGPAIEGLVRRPYQLGVPWWDYALPLAASLYCPLVLVSDTLLLHHIHDQAWNEEEWHNFAAISATYLAEQTVHERAEPRLAAELSARLSEIDEFFAEDGPSKDRDYAVADLTLHLIRKISDAHAISLVAMLSLPAPGEDVPPWQQKSPLAELRDNVLRERRKAVAAAEAASLHAHVSPSQGARPQPIMVSTEPLPEVADHLKLALETRITTASSTTAVLRAGIRDLGKIVALIARLLERRFRRWRRGRRGRLVPH